MEITSSARRHQLIIDQVTYHVKDNERLAQRQFFDFSSRFVKISVHQSGQKKRHSTETALMYVTEQFLKATGKLYHC